MLITLYKIGRVLFRLLATNGFRVKAKKERFTAASSRCRQNLKYENFPASFGRLRQNIAPKSVLHVQHDCFSSFNQSNHWFVALSLTLPSSDLKLPTWWVQTISMKTCLNRYHIKTVITPEVTSSLQNRKERKYCHLHSINVFLSSSKLGSKKKVICVFLINVKCNKIDWKDSEVNFMKNCVAIKSRAWCLLIKKAVGLKLKKYYHMNFQCSKNHLNLKKISSISSLVWNVKFLNGPHVSLHVAFIRSSAFDTIY